MNNPQYKSRQTAFPARDPRSVRPENGKADSVNIVATKLLKFNDESSLCPVSDIFRTAWQSYCGNPYERIKVDSSKRCFFMFKNADEFHKVNKSFATATVVLSDYLEYLRYLKIELRRAAE